MDLIDMYRTFQPKITEDTLFSSAHGTFSRRDHILGHKSTLGKSNVVFLQLIVVWLQACSKQRVGLNQGFDFFQNECA